MAVVNRREIGMARQAVAAGLGWPASGQGRIDAQDLCPRDRAAGRFARSAQRLGRRRRHSRRSAHLHRRRTSGAKSAAAEAQIIAARAGLQVVLDQVSLQVSVSYQAIATDLERIRLGDVATAQAAENLRLTLVNYQNGNATPTDVVDAQTALTQAQTTYSTAIYGYLAGLSQLEYSLGNGQQNLIAWLGQPPPEEIPPATAGNRRQLHICRRTPVTILPLARHGAEQTPGARASSSPFHSPPKPSARCRRGRASAEAWPAFGVRFAFGCC